jgi:hypothetical protein
MNLRDVGSETSVNDTVQTNAYDFNLPKVVYINRELSNFSNYEI